jgi:hypothetical protein
MDQGSHFREAVDAVFHEGPVRRSRVITVADVAADALGAFLSSDYRRTFGAGEGRRAELLEATARTAIECIANSDALYHNLEHTMLVTLAGRDILRGRALRERISSDDWLHFLIACLAHDIGYVRGALKDDQDSLFVVDESGANISLPRGASDAALAPHHVDRSKLFVAERFRQSELVDGARVARMIEFTRFPAPVGRNDAELDAETGLVRAADLIGQLGDPHYIRKANALFHEFAETGIVAHLGYGSPADLIECYPRFFWDNVSDQIAPALRHLNVTVEGRRWIAHLHANVFHAERALPFGGPQP